MSEKGAYDQEKLLAIFYPLVIGCGFVCTITTAIAWHHWKYVLDTCVEVNCGCILNGISTITYFTGGHVAYCHWATFGLVLPVLMAVIFGSYHVWRVCMSSGSSRRGHQQTVHKRSGDIIVMTARTEMTGTIVDVSPNYWIPSTISAALMCLYTIVHAAMLLDGYLQTCRQYRIELLRFMRASGPMVQALQGRITCPAVLDFMDYLHPDPSFDRRRIDRINTSACLVLALIAAWLSVALWLAIVVINAVQARRSRHLRV